MTDFSERRVGEEGERNINVKEKHWLSPAHTPTGDQSPNLLVYGKMLQPAEPPGQGPNKFNFKKPQNTYGPVVPLFLMLILSDKGQRGNPKNVVQCNEKATYMFICCKIEF